MSLQSTSLRSKSPSRQTISPLRSSKSEITDLKQSIADLQHKLLIFEQESNMMNKKLNELIDKMNTLVLDETSRKLDEKLRKLDERLRKSDGELLALDRSLYDDNNRLVLNFRVKEKLEWINRRYHSKWNGNPANAYIPDKWYDMLDMCVQEIENTPAYPREKLSDPQKNLAIRATHKYDMLFDLLKEFPSLEKPNVVSAIKFLLGTGNINTYNTNGVEYIYALFEPLTHEDLHLVVKDYFEHNLFPVKSPSTYIEDINIALIDIIDVIITKTS